MTDKNIDIPSWGTANLLNTTRTYDGDTRLLGETKPGGAPRYSVAQAAHGFALHQGIYRKADKDYALALAEEGTLAIGIVIDVVDSAHFIYAAPEQGVQFKDGHPWGSDPVSLWLSETVPGEITTTGPTIQWLGGVIDERLISFRSQ